MNTVNPDGFTVFIPHLVVDIALPEGRSEVLLRSQAVIQTGDRLPDGSVAVCREGQVTLARGDRQRIPGRKRRQNTGEPSREHGLTAARWPDHQEVMISGS